MLRDSVRPVAKKDFRPYTLSLSYMLGNQNIFAFVYHNKFIPILTVNVSRHLPMVRVFTGQFVKYVRNHHASN